MEFWGVEIKPGEPLKVEPEFGRFIHISQAALGEVKDVEGAKNIPLRLKIDDKDFIIATLAAQVRTQVMFDLVFEKDFELSHDWKDGSVYLMGYSADDEDISNDDDDDDDQKTNTLGEALSSDKAEIKKVAQSESDEDDEDGDNSDFDDEEDSSDLSGYDPVPNEEDLPKKSKKRSAESPHEISVPAKKAKSATPDKTGSRKGQSGNPSLSKAAGDQVNKKSQRKTPPKHIHPRRK